MRFDNAKNNYISSLYTNETSEMLKAKEFAKNNNRAINISAMEGKIIGVLMKMIDAKKIVEIGMLAGYSALAMLQFLPKDGVIYTIEKDNEYIDFAKNNFNDDRINIIEGKALDVLPALDEKGPFDVIFLDAMKQEYPQYLLWAKKNIRKGGVVIADNTLLGGAVYSNIEDGKKPSAPMISGIKEFNNMLSVSGLHKESQEFTSIILPTDEGLTIAVKN